MSTVVEIFVEHLPDSLDDELGVSLFEDMYARAYLPLVAYCRRFSPTADDAEDVAQEAFLRAWSSWDRYSSARPFWPWVTTIARRLCHDRWRQDVRRSRKAEALTSLNFRVASPDELVESAEEGRLARRAFETLRPAQKRLVDLRDLEGWSYEDIARFEGVTIESVRGALKRARCALRESYTRMAAGIPGIGLLGGFMRRAKQRAFRSAIAMQPASEALASADRTGNTLTGLLALVIVLGASPAAAPVLSHNRVRADLALSTPATVAATASLAAPATHAAPKPSSGQGLGLPLTTAALGSDSTAFDHFTPSPNEADDQVVFATGSARGGCAAVTCPALFRSGDGGLTWSRLGATGFTGGTVLLSPNYPTDPRIFVGGLNGLSVSDDEGASFRVLSPIGGDVAMSPGFANGDPRILIGAATGLVYDDSTGRVTPLTLAPIPANSALTFAFAPTYLSTGQMLVGSVTADPSGAQTSSVSLCDHQLCGAPVALPGAAGAPQLVTSPRFAQDGVALAWAGRHLYRSHDGGHSFVAVPLPTSGAVSSVTADGDGRVYLAIRPTSGSDGGGLFASTDGGRSWESLGAGTPLARGALTAAPLPDGRVLAAAVAGTGGGLWCSADDGGSWGSQCAAVTS
jgi:RNA polymerase sigma-70 factor (ECF subfamily)